MTIVQDQEQELERRTQAINRDLIAADESFPPIPIPNSTPERIQASLDEPIRYENSPNELTVAVDRDTDTVTKALRDNSGAIDMSGPAGRERLARANITVPTVPPQSEESKVAIRQERKDTQEQEQEQEKREDLKKATAEINAEDVAATKKEAERRKKIRRYQYYAKLAAKFYVGYQYGYEKGMKLEEPIQEMLNANQLNYAGDLKAWTENLNNTAAARAKARSEQVANSVRNAQQRTGGGGGKSGSGITVNPSSNVFTDFIQRQRQRQAPLASGEGVQQFARGGMVRAYGFGGSAPGEHGQNPGADNPGRSGQSHDPGGDDMSGVGAGVDVKGNPTPGRAEGQDTDVGMSQDEATSLVDRLTKARNSKYTKALAQTFGLSSELNVVNAGLNMPADIAQTKESLEKSKNLGDVLSTVVKSPTLNAVTSVVAPQVQTGIAIADAVKGTVSGASNAMKGKVGKSQEESERRAQERSDRIANTSHPDEVAAMISGTPASRNPNLTQAQRDAGEKRGVGMNYGLNVASTVSPIGISSALGSAALGGMANLADGRSGTGGRRGAGNGGMAIQVQDPTNWRDRLDKLAENSVRAYAGGGTVDGVHDSMDEMAQDQTDSPGWIGKFTDWANPVGKAQADRRKATEATGGPPPRSARAAETESMAEFDKTPSLVTTIGKGKKAAAEKKTAATGTYDSVIEARIKNESTRSKKGQSGRPLPSDKPVVSAQARTRSPAPSPAAPQQAMATPGDAAKRPTGPVYMLSTGGRSRMMDQYERELARSMAMQNNSPTASMDAKNMVAQMRQQYVLQGIAGAEEALAAGDDKAAMAALQKGLSYAPGQISYELSVINGRMIIQGKDPETGENVAAGMVPKDKRKPSVAGPVIADTDFLRDMRKRLEDPAAFGYWSQEREKKTADIASTRAGTASTEMQTGYIPDEQARAERTSALNERKQAFEEGAKHKLAQENAAINRLNAEANARNAATNAERDTRKDYWGRAAINKKINNFDEWRGTPVADEMGFAIDLKTLEKEKDKAKGDEKTRLTAQFNKYKAEADIKAKANRLYDMFDNKEMGSASAAIEGMLKRPSMGNMSNDAITNELGVWLLNRMRNERAAAPTAAPTAAQ